MPPPWPRFSSASPRRLSPLQRPSVFLNGADALHHVITQAHAVDQARDGEARKRVRHLMQVPEAALRCIAGTHRDASLACAARFGLADVGRAEVLFGLDQKGGHLPRGGYDVDHGRPETTTIPAQLH